MRRRVDDGRVGGRDRLMDARTWVRCDRWDGGDQPCLCWFGERQRELCRDGEWPGGSEGELADWVAVSAVHSCNPPMDWTVI